MTVNRKPLKDTKTPKRSLPPRPSFQALRQGLLALDECLVQALAAAEQIYGSQAASDPLRGLYLSLDDIHRLMHQAPGESFFPTPGISGSSQTSPEAGGFGRWEWLRQRFELDDFDMETVWIGLAPEIDPRYERIFAYLQDDVTRRRPSVGLIFDLLGAIPEQRLAQRAHFSPTAPLLHNGLARLVDFTASSSPGTGLPGSALILDESLVRFLLGPDGPDPRISELCTWRLPAQGGIPDAWMLDEPLNFNLNRLKTASRLLAHFNGRPGSGQLQAALYLASERRQALCHTSAAALSESRLGGEASLKLLLRSAEFNEALVLVADAELWQGETWLNRCLDESRADVILAGSTTWRANPEHPLGLQQVIFTLPQPAAQQALWRKAAAAHHLRIDEELVKELTQRFRLRPGQVFGAAATLAASGTLNHRVAGKRKNNSQVEENRSALREAWFAAARAQTGQALEGVAQKINPRQGFADLVLPEDSLAQLQDMTSRVNERDRVLEQWGFGRRLSLGRGVTALFAGPPGTGKTMAAEVVAGSLGLDLFRIDLARVVSKYVGETEKNLNEVFAAAEDSNAILFFDEADALFGRRSEVHDAHDRYANIEVAYLLQKMEEYEGTAILATNLRQNLDEAFLRRLSFVINFPFPDEESRQRIWLGIWPEETPLDNSIDFAWMAQRFRLSGGNIRNIALSAAYLASQDGGRVTGDHLLLATRREYQKIGKLFPDPERVEAG